MLGVLKGILLLLEQKVLMKPIEHRAMNCTVCAADVDPELLE